MKYFFTLINLLFISLHLQAQNFEDGWRYAQDNPYGTARFAGMSGAFSSLGGDMSAIGLNPAGATTFTTNRLTGTLSIFNNNNTANYFDKSHGSDYTSFDDRFISMDQIGAVWVFKSDVSDWNKIALSINFNKDADYGNHIRIQGTNLTGNSVTNYFVNNANGIKLADIKLIDGYDDDYQWLGENLGFGAQQAYLGYQSYIINAVDPNNDNNTQYVANAVYTNVNHQNTINSTGDKSHIDFNIAGTYQNTLQLGFSLSVFSIDYTESNTIIEDNYDPASDLQYLKLRNTLRVEGNGIGIKLGAIYKIAPGTKLSLAYHSPQWLEINEYMKQTVHTEMGNGDIFDISPDIENEFAPYRIITPSKFIIGASGVINKKWLISIDYTYQNMGNLHFKETEADADTSYFDSLNDNISNSMQAIHKLNVGGEIKLSELSLRAGGFMATSPVKADDDLFTSKGYSFGIGYDFGSFVLDMAYVNQNNKESRTLLTLNDAATVDTQQNRFLAGIRYNF